MSDSIEVSRRVRNKSWNAIPVSSCVRNGVNVVAVTNVIRVCCRMRNVPWSPRIDRSIGRMWNAVDMGCCMRNSVHMISMTNVVRMRCCMRNVVVMRHWIEALCVCKLSHSKNCDGGDYDGARFQHVILPKGCLILLTSCGGRFVDCPIVSNRMKVFAYGVPAASRREKARRKPAKLLILGFSRAFENVVNLIAVVNKLTTLEANCFRVKTE